MEYIRLVDEQEKLAFRIGKSTIFYRRYDSKKYREIERRHTRKGPNSRSGEENIKVDTPAINDDLLDYMIIDWENIQSPIPPHKNMDCTTENKLKLPADIRLALVKRGNGETDEDEMEEEKKTSPSMSDTP